MDKINNALTKINNALANINCEIGNITNKINIYTKIKDNYNKIDQTEYNEFMKVLNIGSINEFKQKINGVVNILGKSYIKINLPKTRNRGKNINNINLYFSGLNMITFMNYLKEMLNKKYLTLFDDFNFTTYITQKILDEDDGCQYIMYDLYNIDTTNIFIKNDLLKSQFDNLNEEFKKNITDIYNFYKENNEDILSAFNDLLRTIPEDKNIEIELKDIFNRDEHSNSRRTKMYIGEILTSIINCKSINQNELNNIIQIILDMGIDKIKYDYYITKFNNKDFIEYSIITLNNNWNNFKNDIQQCILKYCEKFYTSPCNKLRIDIVNQYKIINFKIEPHYIIYKYSIKEFQTILNTTWSDYIASHFDVFIEFNTIILLQSIYHDLSRDNIKEYCEKILFNAINVKFNNIFELVFYTNKLIF